MEKDTNETQSSEMKVRLDYLILNFSFNYIETV